MLVIVSNGLSSLLSVAVAPASVYEPPSSTVAGLSPIIVIDGGTTSGLESLPAAIAITPIDKRAFCT